MIRLPGATAKKRVPSHVVKRRSSVRKRQQQKRHSENNDPNRIPGGPVPMKTTRILTQKTPPSNPSIVSTKTAKTSVFDLSQSTHWIVSSFHSLMPNSKGSSEVSHGAHIKHLSIVPKLTPPEEVIERSGFGTLPQKPTSRELEIPAEDSFAREVDGSSIPTESDQSNWKDGADLSVSSVASLKPPKAQRRKMENPLINIDKLDTISSVSSRGLLHSTPKKSTS